MFADTPETSMCRGEPMNVGRTIRPFVFCEMSTLVSKDCLSEVLWDKTVLQSKNVGPVERSSVGCC